MRYIKFFEGFGQDPNSLYEDIRSISYILEDEGYSVVINYYLGLDKESSHYLSKTRSERFEMPLVVERPCSDEVLPGYKVREIVMRIKGAEKGRDASEECMRFLEIMKEHLDYVDESRISTSHTHYRPEEFNIFVKA